MNDQEKQDLLELQNEMAKLKETLDGYQNWIDNEGAELENMLQTLADIAGEEEIDQRYRLPDDYPAPREILQQHFPRTARQCNFSGGWGYTIDDAVEVLEYDPEISDQRLDGVSLEYAFIDKRIREELIFSRSEGERYEELNYNTIQQSLHRINGVPYDHILVEVTAYPEREWNELKNDWESHDCYKDDPDGRKRNLDRKEACKITYQTEYYFNISDFF